MDISTPLPAETVHDTSCALMEVEMSRSTMVSPCSSTNSRSKRARENNANEHSMDVPTGETKKSAPIEDLQSQCSVFTDTIHQDSDFDLELADELVMPAPPCPSPAGYDLPCGAYEELQRQLTALEGLNKRLTREMELDRAKSALEQSLLEEELSSLRQACKEVDERPFAQLSVATPFKSSLRATEMTKSARLSLLTQTVQANNVYLRSVLRSPAFNGFKKA